MKRWERGKEVIGEGGVVGVESFRGKVILEFWVGEGGVGGGGVWRVRVGEGERSG